MAPSRAVRDSTAQGERSPWSAGRRCRAAPEPLELLPRLPRCRHLQGVEQEPGSAGRRRLELGREGGAELAAQPARGARPARPPRWGSCAVKRSAARRTGATAWNTSVALADDTGRRARRPGASASTGRMWRQWRCSWISTAARSIDSRSSKWWNTSRSDTPARSAMRRAVGWGSPSSSRPIRASARARRVRSPRATRPSPGPGLDCGGHRRDPKKTCTHDARSFAATVHRGDRAGRAGHVP